MKVNFNLSSATKLSKKEMKNVKGGGNGPCDGYSHICYCSDGSGVWCGNYNSSQQVDYAIDNHCGDSVGSDCQTVN